MSISTASSQVATLTRYKFVAVGSETSVSGVDANGSVLGYTVGMEQVYLNGVMLVRGSDYTASSGTSITGLTALAANDVLEVLTFSPFNIANALTSVTAGTGLSGGTITSTGTIAIDSTVATLTGSQTLTNKTLTTPTINQGKMYLGYGAKSANYTVASGDEGYILSMASASAQTFSIPTDATFNFAVGTQISFVWITGSGQPSIAAVTPGTTTILSNAAITATPKLRVQNSAASAIKLSANNWLVVGDLA